MEISSASVGEARNESGAAAESGVTPPEKQEVFSSGPLKRVVLADADSVNPDTLLALWKEQDRYLDQLEAKFQEESVTLRESEVKRLRREQLLAMRLQVKEQEIQELSSQVSELKAAQVPSTTQLRSTLVDPGINVIIRQLQKELEEARKKQQETQEELNAWKFTPDSATGKRLMSKCRQLIQENEEIGKMISGGRLAKLEGELAMQGKLCEEMKKNQLEMDEFVQELDEDVEGMQSTVYLLQQQLKEARERIKELEETRVEKTVESEAKAEVSEPMSVDANVEEAKKAPTEEQPEPEATEPEHENVVAEVKPELEAEEAVATSVVKQEEEEEEEPAAEDRTAATRGRRAAAAKAAPTTPTRRTRGQKREPAAAASSAEEASSPKGRASSLSPAGGRPKRRRAPPQRFNENEEAEDEEADNK